MKDIPREELLNRLKEKGVTIVTSCKVIAVEENKVITEDRNGSKKELKADSVIVAVGSVQVNSLFDSLKSSVKEIYLIGDAKEPGNLGAALRSAAEVGVKV
jgi:thioredoxin reductase